jgi:hypothetical protein
LAGDGIWEPQPVTTDSHRHNATGQRQTAKVVFQVIFVEGIRFFINVFSLAPAAERGYHSLILTETWKVAAVAFAKKFEI